MATYIVRRILLMIPTLLGAVTLIFLLMRLLPGDVALYILGSGESSEINKQALQQIRARPRARPAPHRAVWAVALGSGAAGLWEFLLDAPAGH